MSGKRWRAHEEVQVHRFTLVHRFTAQRRLETATYFTKIEMASTRFRTRLARCSVHTPCMYPLFLSFLYLCRNVACRGKEVMSKKNVFVLKDCPRSFSYFPRDAQLREVQDIFSEQDITVIATLKHSDNAKMFKFGVPEDGSSKEYCSKLHPSIWFECANSGERPLAGEFTNISQVNARSKRFTTEISYIAALDCAFVELWGATHSDVPGVVFDHSRTLRPQVFARPAYTAYDARVLEYSELAVAIFPYLDAKGHFVHETLPKVLWLLQELPQHVMVLAPDSPLARRYYDIASKAGFNTSRILPFEVAPKSVLFLQRVYFVGDWPYIHQHDNPNAGGEPTEYPYELMSLLHKTMVPVQIQVSPRRTILLIDRGRRSRYLHEHTALIAALRTLYTPMGYFVLTFGPEDFDSPLSRHIELFNGASVVIGPHGAGFANIVFCAQGTAVIELGFDGSDGMYMDDMYYQLAIGLHLRYWLVLGKGSYSTNVSVDVSLVLAVVNKALNGEEPNIL